MHASRGWISLQDVQLSFGGVQALDNISLDIASGELVAIIGPNGAGKSTLLNTISGLYVPQRGRIEFEGQSLIGRKPHQIARLGIARTFQNLGLFPSLSVLENLLIGSHNRSRPRYVDEVLDMLDLLRERERPAGTLPYGLQKRVELGRALVQMPRLLLLDEPVAGMKRREKEAMARCIRDVHRTTRSTVVMIEHDMGIVMDLAQRIAVLDFGKCIAVGEPRDIREDPAVVQAYLGTAEWRNAAWTA